MARPAYGRVPTACPHRRYGCWARAARASGSPPISALHMRARCCFPAAWPSGRNSIADYRCDFGTPNTPGATPRACIALSVVTAENEQQAIEQNRAFVSMGLLESNVVGSPEQCAARIEAIATEHRATEVLLANWHIDPAQRIATFQCLADALNLSTRHPTANRQPAPETAA